MNFLLIVMGTIIEAVVIYRIRFVYSRQPIGAIVLSLLTILGFYVTAVLTNNKYVRAYTFNFATLNLIFLVVMLFYMWQLQQEAQEITTLSTTDFLLVLGNKCANAHIPLVLAARLDKTIELYQSLTDKPRIIVSGGKAGPGHVTEAELMCQYLIKAGIPQTMIVMETQSTNTIQNLEFSAIKIREIWSKEHRPRVIIVTSDYHIPRTKSQAKKLGLNVNFAAAKTIKMLMWPAMFREFTAILWYHRYELFTVLGMDILFSLSMCI